ncbi:FecR family protein, partial [Verrucomicrobia bacterium]|nr:FecR family protein [Verrucomicrobiota bacterium]
MHWYGFSLSKAKWRSPGQGNRTGFWPRPICHLSPGKATLQMSDKTVLKIRQLTTMVIQASPSGEQMPELNLKSGSVFFFSRESPKEVPFRTSLTSGAIRGTEFELSVTEDDTTTLTMLDGLVDIRSGQGEVA